MYNRNNYGYPEPYGPSDYYRDARQFPDYPQPYQNGTQNYQPNPPIVTPSPNADFIRVPGPQYVHDYIVNPGDRVMFLDINRPIMYMKEADKIGKATTTAYSMTEINFDDLLDTENGAPISNLMVTRKEFDEMRSELNCLTDRFDRFNQDYRQNKQNYNKKTNTNNREESK